MSVVNSFTALATEQPTARQCSSLGCSASVMWTAGDLADSFQLWKDRVKQQRMRLTRTTTTKKKERKRKKETGQKRKETEKNTIENTVVLALIYNDT